MQYIENNKSYSLKDIIFINSKILKKSYKVNES